MVLIDVSVTGTFLVLLPFWSDNFDGIFLLIKKNCCFNCEQHFNYIIISEFHEIFVNLSTLFLACCVQLCNDIIKRYWVTWFLFCHLRTVHWQWLFCCTLPWVVLGHTQGISKFSVHRLSAWNDTCWNWSSAEHNWCHVVEMSLGDGLLWWFLHPVG